MILIDDRQGSAELAKHVSSPTCICHLPYGDFAFTGNGPDGDVKVGIERKSLLDLLNSMASGRLSGHQLIGMQEFYDQLYLVVEGIWKDDRKSGILKRFSGKTWKSASLGQRRFMTRAVWAYLNTLTIACNVVTIRTGSQWETGRWLDAVFRWWNKPWTKHNSHKQFHNRPEAAPLTRPNTVTRLAAQLDGIGWGRARAVGKRFRTVEEMVMASEDDWREIEGIGPKLAQSVLCQIKGGDGR